MAPDDVVNACIARNRRLHEERDQRVLVLQETNLMSAELSQKLFDFIRDNPDQVIHERSVQYDGDDG